MRICEFKPCFVCNIMLFLSDYKNWFLSDFIVAKGGKEGARARTLGRPSAD